MDDIEFSALLCSRLCHDLISPVGAIANGLEILGEEEDTDMRGEVMKLLTQSAEVTSAKLKFFRLSFGAAGGFGEKLPIREAENAIKGLYATGNIDLIWQSEVGVMDKNAMKLMLNMVMLSGEGLVRGGEIFVNIKDKSPERENPENQIIITAKGDKVIFNDSVRLALLGELAKDMIEPKSAPAFLARNMAQKLGSTIEYTAHSEQSFSLQVAYAG